MIEEEIHPLDVALSHSIHGNPEESEKILRNQPQDDFRVLFNLGWHEMRHGNLKKGFEYMNYGRFIDVYGNKPIPGKIWKDESLENKTLLFRCEGGYGDEILNFRFAKNFKDMGARVLISCSNGLKELFSRHGFICVDNNFTDSCYYDYWIPSMSAPYVLNLEYSDIKGTPYIFPKKPLQLFSKDKSLKVGIRWSGNPKFEHEQHRKFPKELLINLHSTKNTTFYSLQRDNDCIDGLPFADMRDKMNTWDDTANIIADLDLVITSCTSIAHLSAAMGKPTWIITPVLPYYTWAIPGKKTVWYDSVTLFKQDKYDDWDSVFQKVQKELNKLANDKYFL